MSESIEKPFRAPVDKPSGEFTFDIPNLLLDTKEKDGFTAHFIRNGRAAQLVMRTRIEWQAEPVDESVQVFALRALNHIGVGGQIVSVLNNEATIEGMLLPATSPTVAEYLDAIGQERMVHSDCSRDPDETKRVGRPAYKVVRSFITVP